MTANTNNIIRICLVFTLFSALIPAIVFFSNTEPDRRATSAKLSPSERIMIKVLDEKSGKLKEYEQTDFIVLSLMAQIPAGYEDEAIKAQAVLIRTYLERRRRAEEAFPTKELKGALLSTDRTKYQTFFTEAEAKKYFSSDYDEVYERFYSLAVETEDELLIYDGEPVIPAYHAVSCGVTRSALDAWGEDIPYLQAADSSADKNSPDFKTTVEMTSSELISKLKKAFPDADLSGSAKTLLETETGKDGILSKVIIGGISVDGGEFCKALGLCSPCVSVKYKKDKFTFTVKGLGHLVGLSLYGANSMAKDGSSRKDILEHYFTGAKLETAP